MLHLPFSCPGFLLRGVLWPICHPSPDIPHQRLTLNTGRLIIAADAFFRVHCCFLWLSRRFIRRRGKRSICYWAGGEVLSSLCKRVIRAIDKRSDRVKEVSRLPASDYFLELNLWVNKAKPKARFTHKASEAKRSDIWLSSEAKRSDT